VVPTHTSLVAHVSTKNLIVGFSMSSSLSLVRAFVCFEELSYVES